MKQSKIGYYYRNFIEKKLFLLPIVMFFVLIGCEKEEGNLPEITTKEISNIADITAECGGTVTDNGGLDIVAMGICYTTTGDEPTVEDNFIPAGNYSHSGIVEEEWNFTAVLTGLVPKTSYKVRAYVANEKGVAYGETKSFETKAGKTYHTLTPDMLETFTQEVYEGPKESLVDGNFDTFWHSAWSGAEGAEVHPLPHYVQINFNEPTAIGGMEYWHRNPSGTAGRPNAWDVQTSDDGVTWTTVWTSATDLDITIMPPAANVLSFDQNYTSKHFRFRILSNPGSTTYTYLSEIKVYHNGLLD